MLLSCYYPIITIRHEQRFVFTGNRSSYESRCEDEYPALPKQTQCNRRNCPLNKKCRGHCFIQRSPPYGQKPPCKCLLKNRCCGNSQGQQAAYTTSEPKQKKNNKECNCPSMSQISCTPPVVDFCVPQAKTKEKKQKNSKTKCCCPSENPSSIGICCYAAQDKEIKKQNSCMTISCCPSEESLPEIKECCNKSKCRKRKTSKSNCQCPPEEPSSPAIEVCCYVPDAKSKKKKQKPKKTNCQCPPEEETSTPPIKVCYPVKNQRIITCGSSFIGRPPVLKSNSQIIKIPGMNAQIPRPYFNYNRKETNNPPLCPNSDKKSFDMDNVGRSRSRARRRNVCIRTYVDYDYVPSTSANKHPSTRKPRCRCPGSDITHSRTRASNHFIPPDVNHLPPARHPSVNYRQQQVKSDLTSDNGNSTDSRTCYRPHSRRLR